MFGANKCPPCTQYDIHCYDKPEGDQAGPLCKEVNCKQEELTRRLGVPPPPEGVHENVDVCRDTGVQMI